MALIPHIVIEQGYTHILKYYILIVYVVVATNSTHTKVVHTNIVPLLPPKWYFFHGSGSKTTGGFSVPLQ